MNNLYLKTKITALAALATFILSGCGGGGGGATEGTITTTSTTTTTTVITYPAGSPLRAFFDGLNEFRTMQGLGVFKQDTKLDTAAQNHVNYVIANGNVLTHTEDPAKSGFTGVDASDRAAFAGYGTYAYGVAEIGGSVFGNGAFAIETQIASIYHRQALIAQYPTDIGIATGGSAEIYFASMGHKTVQSVAADYFGTYPVNGQTGVRTYASTGEIPYPYGSVTNPGYPIHVAIVATSTLTVSSFTVTEAGQTTPVDAVVLTKASDSLLVSNVAFLYTKQPLKPNTTYNVIFNGAINGQALPSKLWSFTTGST